MGTFDQPTDILRPFTFDLEDGASVFPTRRVTYAGVDLVGARHRAQFYCGAKALNGRPADRCECHGKDACPVREGGWLVCRNCAGVMS
jgi:hypothetical protein